MTTISLVRAQAELSETVQRTKAGPIVLEESGQPVAVVLSIEEYRRLSDAETRERQSEKAYERIFGPFERGEFRELSERDWQALLDGERKSEHDPESWALPPKG